MVVLEDKVGPLTDCPGAPVAHSKRSRGPSLMAVRFYTRNPPNRLDNGSQLDPAAHTGLTFAATHFDVLVDNDQFVLEGSTDLIASAGLGGGGQGGCRSLLVRHGVSGARSLRLIAFLAHFNVTNVHTIF